MSHCVIIRVREEFSRSTPSKYVIYIILCICTKFHALDQQVTILYVFFLTINAGLLEKL